MTLNPYITWYYALKLIRPDADISLRYLNNKLTGTRCDLELINIRDLELLQHLSLWTQPDTNLHSFAVFNNVTLNWKSSINLNSYRTFKCSPTLIRPGISLTVFEKWALINLQRYDLELVSIMTLNLTRCLILVPYRDLNRLKVFFKPQVKFDSYIFQQDLAMLFVIKKIGFHIILWYIQDVTLR